MIFFNGVDLARSQPRSHAFEQERNPTLLAQAPSARHRKRSSEGSSRETPLTGVLAPLLTASNPKQFGDLLAGFVEFVLKRLEVGCGGGFVVHMIMPPSGGSWFHAGCRSARCALPPHHTLTPMGAVSSASIGAAHRVFREALPGAASGRREWPEGTRARSVYRGLHPSTPGG